VWDGEPRVRSFQSDRIGDTAITYLHPTAGTLRFETAALLLADRPGARMTVHTPADDATRSALVELVEGGGPGLQLSGAR
jgi:hypothetical protein